MPVTSPLSVWFSVMMLLSTQETATKPEPVCVKLVKHLGPKRVERLNQARPADKPDLLQVCSRVAREARRRNLDPAIAVAVAYAESGLRWRPTTSDRFLGPMQVGREWCKMPRKGCLPDGVEHLLMWRSKSESWEEALWGYVGGHANELSQSARKRKRAYITRVMKMSEAISDRR